MLQLWFPSKWKSSSEQMMPTIKKNLCADQIIILRCEIISSRILFCRTWYFRNWIVISKCSENLLISPFRIVRWWNRIFANFVSFNCKSRWKRHFQQLPSFSTITGQLYFFWCCTSQSQSQSQSQWLHIVMLNAAPHAMNSQCMLIGKRCQS